MPATGSIARRRRLCASRLYGSAGLHAIPQPHASCAHFVSPACLTPARTRPHDHLHCSTALALCHIYNVVICCIVHRQVEAPSAERLTLAFPTAQPGVAAPAIAGWISTEDQSLQVRSQLTHLR